MTIGFGFVPPLGMSELVVQQSLMFCFLWQILSFYQTDLLPSESVAELFDVAGWCLMVAIMLISPPNLAFEV